MSMAQLVRGVGRLSLGSGLCSGGSCGPATLPSLRHLHITVAVERHLDSRKNPPSRKPSTRTGRWVMLESPYKTHEYTIEPIPTPRVGGRGPNGRIWNHRRMGGDKRDYLMIDRVRAGPDTKVKELVERITKIQPDVNRSAYIALVAGGTRERWIIATASMKEGDTIRSTRVVADHAVIPREGDSYPLGSLPMGTLISCLETQPDAGVRRIVAAGAAGYIVKKQADNKVVVRLPSKRELILDERCAAAVGQVSNVAHENRVLGTAGAKRRLGIKQSSGLWHRKDGRHGRKIHKNPRPAIDHTKSKTSKPPIHEMTLD